METLNLGNQLLEMEHRLNELDDIYRSKLRDHEIVLATMGDMLKRMKERIIALERKGMGDSP